MAEKEDGRRNDLHSHMRCYQPISIADYIAMAPPRLSSADDHRANPLRFILIAENLVFFPVEFGDFSVDFNRSSDLYRPIDLSNQ